MVDTVVVLGTVVGTVVLVVMVLWLDPVMVDPAKGAGTVDLLEIMDAVSVKVEVLRLLDTLEVSLARGAVAVVVLEMLN